MSSSLPSHRAADVTVKITNAAGQPLANAAVTVRQTAHKFLFGSNIFALNPADSAPLQQAYQARFKELLNYATLPFYWGGFEPTPGELGTERVKTMAKWCAAQGIATKGHPLCWHEVWPKWMLDRTDAEVLSLQLARIEREVTAFRGLIDIWDVLNEAVVMPNFTRSPSNLIAICGKIGAVELIKRVFAAARAANPSATLLLNDYIVTADYEQLIDRCLQAGIEIDVIGIQSHMHAGYWGADKAHEVCDRFSRFGKPLHFTELTLQSGDMRQNIPFGGPRLEDWSSTAAGEDRQCGEVTDFYTTLFSHPGVHGITWWDFCDANAWMGAPAGLIRKDGTPKPAYDALLDLVRRRWWTGETKLRTDATGAVRFRATLGRYALSASGREQRFEVHTTGDTTATVSV